MRATSFHRPPPEPRAGGSGCCPASSRPSYSFELHPRDEAGFRALTEIRGTGLNPAAEAVAQSADHVQSFFVMLRLELAFYLGCLNLRRRLEAEWRADLLPGAGPRG